MNHNINLKTLCCLLAYTCQYSLFSVLFLTNRVFSGGRMNNDEKLDKVCEDFLKLGAEQQDYILGIMQALLFAESTYSINKSENQPQKNAN